MSIGETLFRARRDAGLSIAEVSSRTQIRLNVIDDIEHDDYSACGGDHHARDTIAAIARAVGVDAGPLIEAYTACRRPAGWIAATQSSEPAEVVEVPEAFTPPVEAELVTADEDTQPIPMGLPSEPVTAGEPALPLTIGESPGPVTPAWTAIPARPSWPVQLALADRRPFIWIALGGALLLAAILGGILLITGTSGQATRHAVVAGRHDTGRRGATHLARTPPPPGHSARSHTRGHARALVPASIQAFGPGGAGHGDSPELARRALAGKAAAPWHSAWYTTPRFGNLQAGTGLLLDMGRPVTITSARIALGNHAGADLALRIGNSPALASLPPVAHANGVEGVVSLKTAPTRGRYVLVWFTRLPPDQAGTFQVAVYNIKLRGHP